MKNTNIERNLLGKRCISTLFSQGGSVYMSYEKETAKIVLIVSCHITLYVKSSELHPAAVVIPLLCLLPWLRPMVTTIATSCWHDNEVDVDDRASNHGCYGCHRESLPSNNLLQKQKTVHDIFLLHFITMYILCII